MRCLQISSINFKVVYYLPIWTKLEVEGENKIFFSFNKWKMIIKEREVMDAGEFN